ncbi:histamine N-methyltransferase-like [Acanthaster planci]|uniref:Histamine N-methyltransferase-like n=1 Tax=Acanthaster planci TaxID=133434 RepID=A0A8B7XJX2_ACAPL|nr:histamine N-methyltransferase-like [Acanthaster planci]
MNANSLPSLLGNPDHYVKAFKVFCSRSAKFSVYSDWVDKVFSKAVVSKLQTSSDTQEELRVLGVGSGSGEMDCKMLEKLSKRFPRIDNRVVEPSQELVDKYQALVQSKAGDLQGVKCDWRHETIEQYEEAGNLTKFHVISAVHSMYYVDNFDSTLMYLYNCLVPGGVLATILLSENSGLSRFRTRFPCLQGRNHNTKTSTDICGSLDQQSIPHARHLHHQRVRVDITDCFDRASVEGGLLVDFITNVVDFRGAASDDLRRSVMEYLASSDCSERDNGAILMNTDWDSVVVYKPAESN